MNKKLANHDYNLEPLFSEDFPNLDNWVALEDNGTWQTQNAGVEGEWLRASPSLFFKEKIHGDFVWQIDVTRLPTDQAFLDRYKATKWGISEPPVHYNFNFWIRADVPDPSPTGRETFFEEYPKWLKTGWNGMGDDHWHSYFNTVVWKPGENWIRLRRGPNYEKREDIQNIVPFLPWNKKHRFTFAIRNGRIRLYFDESTLVYDHEDLNPYNEGYIGLCVWICKTRFENMRVWRMK